MDSLFFLLDVPNLLLDYNFTLSDYFIVFFVFLSTSVDTTRADEHISRFSHNQIVCIVLFIIFSGFILKNILLKMISVKKYQ